jgi:hypothetical protein
MRAGEISIWFFIGISLLLNGILITGAGLWEIFHVPMHPVVLFNLHANLWWGALLLMLGAAACVRFSPKRVQARSTKE